MRWSSLPGSRGTGSPIFSFSLRFDKIFTVNLASHDLRLRQGRSTDRIHHRFRDELQTDDKVTTAEP